MSGTQLEDYLRKRDFSSTPEPSGGTAPPGGEPRFVVHEHHARSLHWDLRLERDGVLASWAVPRGIPRDPSTNHLAVPTEDHPLSYLDFSGDIPAGNYGAGTMSIWDSGTYEAHKWDSREVMVTLRGRRLRGTYVLFRTGEGRWMIHRMDPPDEPARDPMPRQVEPMLATLAQDLPADEGGWAFEVKWDGVRAVAFLSEGRLRLQGRRGADFTPQYPEVRALGEALADHQLVLDGEVVSLDDDGRPSFELLQRRMHRRAGPSASKGGGRIVYMVFDLLYLDGHVTMQLPYSDRRRLLDGLALNGPAWQTPSHHVGDGSALVAASREQGLEGLVAKRLDSAYEPGKRSRSWLKVKNRMSQELVVGGWMPGAGKRSATLGSLLVGYYGPGGLHYAGRVGSGLTEDELRALGKLLEGKDRPDAPFSAPDPLPPDVRRTARFVEPELVVEVEFAEWTEGDTLRAPVYKGRRVEVDPAAVTREARWAR